jgi:hypothetical protein
VTAAATARRRGGVSRGGAGRARPRTRRAAAGPSRRHGPSRPALLGATAPPRRVALRAGRHCFPGTAAAGRRYQRTVRRRGAQGHLARCAGVAPMIAVWMIPKLCANLEHARPAAVATRRCWLPKCGKLLRANNTLDLVEQPECEISSAIQM